MEYVVFTYANNGSNVLLKAFDSYSKAEKYANKVEEAIDFPVFVRERRSSDHDEDFRPYKFSRG